MAGETQFAVIKVKQKALEFEGKHGDYEDFISGKAELNPSFPIMGSSFVVSRPWTAGTKRTSTTEGMDVAITMEWVKESPTMIQACLSGDEVDVTIFTVNQDPKASDKYVAEVTITMTKGRFVSAHVSPGSHGSETTVTLTYSYTTIEFADFQNVKAKFQKETTSA